MGVPRFLTFVLLVTTHGPSKARARVASTFEPATTERGSRDQHRHFATDNERRRGPRTRRAEPALGLLHAELC